MIDNDRLSIYLDSLETDDPEWINRIEQYGREHQIPLVRRETAALLLFMLRLMKARRVLEIGTAIGYSASLMAAGCESLEEITTIEIRPEHAALARENFKEAEAQGVKARIKLLEGDATKLLPQLSGNFDLIFLDAAKGQYALWLPELKRLLAAGGVLFADNVLQEGSILDSRFLIERRDRTIHKRIREFLFQIKHDEDLTTAILSVGDGVSLSTKNKLDATILEGETWNTKNLNF